MKNNVEENLTYARYHFDKVYFQNPKPCGDILLHQLGEMYCKAGADIAEHRQRCYEFTYILSGGGTVTCNSKSKKVKPHDCVWCKPGDLHRIVSDTQKTLRYCYVAYSSNSPDITMIHNAVFESDDFFASFADDESEALFIKMLGDIEKEPPFANLALGHLIHLLIIGAYRKLKDRCNDGYEREKSNTSMLVYQITHYIENNFLKMNGLKELENVFHYNYQYLAKCFYKIMNCTINSYFVGRKMAKALEMLFVEQFSAAKTAEALGYSCPQAFSLAFKSYFGVTPGHYKKIIIEPV